MTIQKKLENLELELYNLNNSLNYEKENLTWRAKNKIFDESYKDSQREIRRIKGEISVVESEIQKIKL